MGIEINRGIPIENKNKSYSLNSKPVDDRQFIPKKFKEVASNMEQQFAEYMLNEMNKTIENTDEESGAGMDYYKALQTTERAKIMAQKDNLGLQNVILDQIYPKRLRNEIALKQYEAQVDKIHHNLPKLERSVKNDTIVMGKNESTPENSAKADAVSNNQGGLK